MEIKDKIQLHDPFELADTLYWLLSATYTNWVNPKYKPKGTAQRRNAQQKDESNVHHALQSIYKKLNGKKITISMVSDADET